MIDIFAKWAEQISKDLPKIDKIQNSLGDDDVFTIEKVLLLNATICRALFDEATTLSKELNSENTTVSGFDPDTIKRLDFVQNKKLDLKNSLAGSFQQNSLTLSYRQLCDKIIHVNSLELWKSEDAENPSFYINSDNDVNGSSKMKFYHVRWSQFGDLLRDVIGASAIDTGHQDHTIVF